MDDQSLVSFEIFKNDISGLISKNHLNEIDSLIMKICKIDCQDRPKRLSNIFKLVADGFCKFEKGKEKCISDAVSMVVEELLENKFVSSLGFLESLFYFLDDLKFSENLKECKNMTEMVNKLLEKKLWYLKMFKMLINTLTKWEESFEEIIDPVKNAFVGVVLSLLHSLNMPRSTDYKDVCILDNENMKVYKSIVENGCEALQEILTFRNRIAKDVYPSIENLVDVEKGKIINYVLKKSAVNIVYLVLANFGNHEWTTKKLNKQSEDILQFVCRVAKAKGLESLLVGDEISDGNDDCAMFSHGLMGPLLKEIHSRFKNNGWKQEPIVKHVFLYAVMNIRYPNLKDYISILVPILIELIEDYKCENQILGIGCLEYIIDNVNPSDLTLYNHAELVYDVLFKQLYGVNAETLKVLLPCLKKLLYVIDPFPERINVNSFTSKWDETIRQLICNMEYESKIEVRRILAENLKLYIPALGINCVKHLKSLLRLTSHYLEFYDGEEETVRVHALEIMKNFIVCCWPVMSEHVGQILKVVLKLVVDINIKDSFTTEKSRVVLENLGTDIVRLLKQCCGDECVDEYLKMALDASIDESFNSVKRFIGDCLKVKTSE